MIKILPLSLVISLTAVFSISSFAGPLDKPHSFGAQIGAGGLEFKNSRYDGDGVAHVYGFYNYAYTENLSLEVGLNIGADVDNFECYEDNHDDWHCSRNNNDSLFGLGVDEVEYSNLVAAVKGILPLSKRSSLYGKVGAQFYDYELSRHNRILYDDSGVGLYLAAGWQYEWDRGIGMNVGFERYDMRDLESNVLSIGMSYHF